MILDLLLSAAGQFNSVSSLSEIKKERREGRKEKEIGGEGGSDERRGIKYSTLPAPGSSKMVGCAGP